MDKCIDNILNKNKNFRNIKDLTNFFLSAQVKFNLFQLSNFHFTSLYTSWKLFLYRFLSSSEINTPQVFPFSVGSDILIL